ncbi:hypothetical protein [Nocardioides sp. KR10-350]|uniref:hypothetical protein n=1 Tax=Nocardioides cheoyonin TaxID=3156615 RepID=UPI0032B4F02B
MDQKAARAAVAKAFKARKVPLRKGHWRLVAPEVTWYVDLRSDGPGPTAPLRFEAGAWLPVLEQPEPEGGAVDCPLLVDVPLDPRPAAAAEATAAADALVDRLESLGTVDSLAEAWRGGRLEGALVDRSLRTLFGD